MGAGKGAKLFGVTENSEIEELHELSNDFETEENQSAIVDEDIDGNAMAIATKKHIFIYELDNLGTLRFKNAIPAPEGTSFGMRIQVEGNRVIALDYDNLKVLIYEEGAE